jgi:hypothetical protein
MGDKGGMRSPRVPPFGMTEKRYLPRLTVEERDQLEAMGRRGRTPVRQVTRARLLLRIDEVYPEAERLVLVLDNLSTHGFAALYEALPPAEARRVADKLELHFTPKHGSWLNMAEIELSVLARQCLDRRFADATSLRAEVAAWQVGRDDASRPIRWRFTTADARIKLRRLYPSL